MLKNKIKNILCLIINIFIFVSSMILLYLGLTSGAGEGQVGESMYGIGYLKAFTVLSNLFSAFICFILIFYNIRALSKRSQIYPRRLIKLFSASTTSVLVTFITVVVFLAPMFEISGSGYLTMFKGDMFFFHFLNPILAFIEFSFILKAYILYEKDALIGIVPTFLYSIVYCYMVLNNKWSDFYGFTFGGKLYLIPFVLLIMYLCSLFITRVIIIYHNKNIKI